MSRTRLIALLLAFGTLLVFLPAGRFSFINYDDGDYVSENSFIKNGLNATDIHWAFTAYFSGNWHPLTWMSHMLDCELFGMNAGAHHFVNVLWHSLNVALLFIWLSRLTGKMGPSAFIAALFAWHPLHVESVAWVAERKDVLSTFFALLTLLAYTHYVQEKRRGFLWLALVCFALGLMSKPMLVTLPFVLLLLDYWPLQRLFPFRAAVLVEKLPFFVLTAVSCAVTFLAQRQGEAVMPLQMVTLPHRLQNALMAVLGYLEKLFVPVNLSVIYPMPKHVSAWELGLAAAVLIGISALAWRWRRQRPYFLMGWLWFLGTLVPVIGLVQVGVQALADRYMYIPSIGCFIALVFLLAEVAERVETPRVIMTGFATVICVACILGTEHQLQFWRDSETLFRHAIAVTGDNEVAHLNLGTALASAGRSEEALPEFREALRLNPGWHQLHNNVANILDMEGHLAEAAAEYRQAIQLDPRIPYQHNSLGMTLVELGQYPEALAEFSEAERLDPTYPWPHIEQARFFFAQGRDLDAVAQLHEAVRLAPDDFQVLATTARYLAANANPAARDGNLAVTLAIKANALTDNSQSAIFDVLGIALAETGDYTNAVQCAQNALMLATTAKLATTNQIKLRLDLYEKNQPWHESFRKTNAPAAP
jgi:Flp pilus assembly protein TadD